MSTSLSTIPALAATLLLAIALFADLRHDIRRLVRGRNVCLLGLFAWFLLEALTESGELRGYSQGDYNLGVFSVVLGILGFLLGYHGTTGCPLFEPMAARVTVLDDPQVLWRVVLCCGVIGFAPILFYSGLQLVDLIHGILGMRQTWGGLIARGRYGGFREAMLQLENLITGVSAFAALLFLDRRSTAIQRAFCAAVCLWPVLRGFGSGTRHQLLMAALPIMAVVYFRCKPKLQRRFVILGLSAIPLVYALMAAIGESRNTGRFSWDARNKATYVGNEMFQELLYIRSKVPDALPYQMGYSYVVQLCAPIPRFLWPGKPSLETGIMMAKLRGEVNQSTGEAFYTRSPGILGEMYLNFGLPGILLLNAVGGWLVRGWDRIAEKHVSSIPVLIFHLAGLSALFFLGRSVSIALFYPLGFFAVAVYLISRGRSTSASNLRMGTIPQSQAPWRKRVD
jgi:oligosaccharide repeat unit polymerase